MSQQIGRVEGDVIPSLESRLSNSIYLDISEDNTY